MKAKEIIEDYDEMNEISRFIVIFESIKWRKWSGGAFTVRENTNIVSEWMDQSGIRGDICIDGVSFYDEDDATLCLLRWK